MSALQPDILILITHTGGGHLNLAQSLKETLEPDYTVAVDNPQLALVNWSYTTFSRHWVKFLHWQYASTDSETAALRLQRALAVLDFGQTQRMLARLRPRLIIVTHSMLSYVAARANEGSRHSVPLVFQLTDLEQLHMTWFTEKYADAYLAPTREIFAQARACGIARERLFLTGRPVRRQFREVSPDAKNATLTACGLDPTLFTLFLQGGAVGSAETDAVLEEVLKLDLPIQIILAAGNNRAMNVRYTGVARVYTLPFTSHIASYMAAADVIAGKAGASFISEAYTLEKPFIVTSFIPGQETPNLRFIERHDLGWVCLEPSTRLKLLASLVSQPAMLTEKVALIRAYKAWNEQANTQLRPVIDRLLS